MRTPGAKTVPPSPPVHSRAADSPTAQTSTDDEAVLLRTFHDLRDELLSTLVYLLGNRDDAQDAAQEAFLKCWRTRTGLPDVTNLRAWIFRVAMNTARDMQRSAWNRRVKSLATEEIMVAAKEQNHGLSLEDQESVARLREAINDLRDEEKEVFLLRQNGELTYEEIAVLRATPVGTVKTQMRAALQKLRRVLNPEPAAE